VKLKASPEDVELFRKTVGTVKPLGHDRIITAPRRRAGRARFTKAERLAALEESPAGVAPADALAISNETLSYRRPGVPENVLRKLRRRAFRIEGEIDLHGLTAAQAKRVLLAFLTGALARHAVCVRIIHGKGLRSGSRGAVLKSTTDAVLRQVPGVMAYVSAAPTDGGTGATHVLLTTAR
jgi:DNA-nicking Smr family endonuclease